VREGAKIEMNSESRTQARFSAALKKINFKKKIKLFSFVLVDDKVGLLHCLAQGLIAQLGRVLDAADDKVDQTELVRCGQRGLVHKLEDRLQTDFLKKKNLIKKFSRTRLTTTAVADCSSTRRRSDSSMGFSVYAGETPSR